MPVTKDIEARLREHMDLIGEDNWHEVDRDVITLLAAVGRTRKALKKQREQHDRRGEKSAADCTVLVALKCITKALEGCNP